MATIHWLTPDFLSRLEALELSVRWVRAGTRLGGRFPVSRRGASIEFADYAPYYPGDDIRAIDWNLYARLDRLFVKTYKEEIELSVDIIVDATSSMGLPMEEKFERAKQVAVSLGYVGLSAQHQVRLDWIAAGPPAPSPWFRRRSDLARMVQQAEAARLGSGQIEFARWMERAVVTLGMRGGQAILITDAMVPPADLFRALHVLMIRNLEVKVIQLLTPQELHPARLFRGGLLVDVETGATHQLAYSASELEQAVAQHNELVVRFCKRHGILFARHVLDEPLDAFIIKTLPARGFLE